MVWRSLPACQTRSSDATSLPVRVLSGRELSQRASDKDDSEIVPARDIGIAELG